MADFEAKVVAAEHDIEAAGEKTEEAIQSGQEEEVEYWREERRHFREALRQVREKELIALKSLKSQGQQVRRVSSWPSPASYKRVKHFHVICYIVQIFVPIFICKSQHDHRFACRPFGQMHAPTIMAFTYSAAPR